MELTHFTITSVRVNPLLAQKRRQAPGKVRRVALIAGMRIIPRRNGPPRNISIPQFLSLQRQLAHHYQQGVIEVFACYAGGKKSRVEFTETYELRGGQIRPVVYIPADTTGEKKLPALAQEGEGAAVEIVDEPSSAPASGEEAEPSIEGLSKKELVKLAEERGLDPSGKSKQQLLEELQ